MGDCRKDTMEVVVYKEEQLSDPLALRTCRDGQRAKILKSESIGL